MPYRTEHSARQHAPSGYKSCGRKSIVSKGRPLALLTCSPSGKRSKHDTEVASVRFPVEYWTPAAALKWLRDHDFSTERFEPALDEQEYVAPRSNPSPFPPGVTVKKGPEFEYDGIWIVTAPDGSKGKMYFDRQSGLWWDPDVSGGTKNYFEGVLGSSNKAEAVEAVLEKLAKRGARRNPRSQQREHQPRTRGGQYDVMSVCPRCGKTGEGRVDLQDLDAEQMEPEDRQWTGESICLRCTNKLLKKYAALPPPPHLRNNPTDYREDGHPAYRWEESLTGLPPPPVVPAGSKCRPASSRGRGEVT